MRAALIAALALVLTLLAVESAAAQPRRHGTPADDGYFSQYVTGPGGRKTPLRDYPGSAAVITRKQMDDFQARSLCDVLRLAPGVVTGGC